MTQQDQSSHVVVAVVIGVVVLTTAIAAFLLHLTAAPIAPLSAIQPPTPAAPTPSAQVPRSLAPSRNDPHPAPIPTSPTAADQISKSTNASTAVYEANFTKEVGLEWSRGEISTTPNAKYKFLGPFRDLPVRFTLKNIPAHQCIRLTFDLMTFNRWNGDSTEWGRDLWDLRVVGGQPLIHTTFSNCGFFNNNNEQSFPDQYPWYPTHIAWTGAAAKKSLGYRTSQGKDSWGCDSTYAFDIVFPHAGDSLDLLFKSQIKGRENKPYGFLNFKVATVDRAAIADEKTLAAWWNDLAGEDPVKAYAAIWSLVATGDAATTYIRDHLPPAPADGSGPPLNIDQKALWHYGSFSCNAAPVRQRARAIHVLEVINSEAARGLLDKIGYKGTPQGAPPDPWMHQTDNRDLASAR